MPYRNIFVSNPASLRLKSNQLIVNNGEEFSFPIEDIRSIVVDNPLTTLSAALISFLAENGVCLITCDNKHMPVAQMMPLSVYCRASKRLNLQIEQSKPKLKKIWQQIVVRKIENQSRCLEFCSLEQMAEKLRVIARSVQSGDVTNREGYAAALYFRALFGEDFSRSKECAVNAALNYGYAIMRSFIAKNIAAYGLEPSLGIHHRNQLNAFNLADDLIEPFRPVIDLFVARNFTAQDEELDTYHKAELVRLINSAAEVDGERYSVAKATELMVQGVIASFESEKTLLRLPSLLETAYFDYD